MNLLEHLYSITESSKIYTSISQYIQGASAVFITLIDLLKNQNLEPRVREYVRFKLKLVIRSQVDLSDPSRILNMMRDLQIPTLHIQETEEGGFASHGAAYGSENSLFKRLLKSILKDKYSNFERGLKDIAPVAKKMAGVGVIAAFSALVGKHLYQKHKENVQAKQIIDLEINPFLEKMVDMIIDKVITEESQINSFLNKLEDSVIDKYNLLDQATVTKSNLLASRWS